MWGDCPIDNGHAWRRPTWVRTPGLLINICHEFDKKLQVGVGPLADNHMRKETPDRYEQAYPRHDCRVRYVVHGFTPLTVSPLGIKGNRGNRDVRVKFASGHVAPYSADGSGLDSIPAG